MRKLKGAPSQDWSRWIVPLLWVGAIGGVIAMKLYLPFGCDAREYLAALKQYRLYMSGQQSSTLPYSPLFMVPVMGFASLLPIGATITFYWLAYFCGLGIQLWIGMRFVSPQEYKVFRYVLPAITFFPGLLFSDADIISSGNLAYILYGMILGTAAIGWSRGRWSWFYIAVLLSSFAKVHMLTLLAVAVLCESKQWKNTIATGVAGVGLYALQSRIWPGPFHAYLKSLSTLSQSHRDFGCSPVGNLARVLQFAGSDYLQSCLIFYLFYFVLMFIALLTISRLYRDQRVDFQNWAPVMLVGVVLLNPRLLAYDVAAVSLPMSLILCRSLRLIEDGASQAKRLVVTLLALTAINIVVEWIDARGWVPDTAKAAEMLLMLAVFGLGVRSLWREAGRAPLAVTPLPAAAYLVDDSDVVS